MFCANELGIVSTSVISRKWKITVAGLINGDKIALLRKEKGWDQRKLAAEAHVDPSVVSRLERNLQDDCMLSIVNRIASVLDVSIDELLNRGYQPGTVDLDSELQAVISILARQTPIIQQQAAGILRGYISTLK
jgi:transcriptional regulator with XRE-family HTH domain